MRKLTVILLSVTIALLGLTAVSLAENPKSWETPPVLLVESEKSYWNTPQEYEKATGNKIEKFNEAPMLRTMVAAGEIPPMEKRLPEDPQVIAPVEEIGQYGGTWHLPYSDPGMGTLKMIMYDPPVRTNREASGYIPGLLKKWEYSNGGRTLTFYFRRGLKWSDGHPFTTEDLRFWWEDLATNEEYNVVLPPGWLYNEDRTLAKVKYIDDYTISFTFKEPHYDVPRYISCGFWNWEPIMKPKHYLKQFHPKYNPEMKDYTTLTDKDVWWQNPDYPTLFAWHVVEYKPGARVTFERNPYYWKIDTAGNQLPYIDRIEAKYVKEPEVRLLQAVRGEYDATFRGVHDIRQIPLLKEKEKDGDYRVILWKNGAGGWPALLVNQTYNVEKTKDPFMRELLRNKKFRRALSLAIDRKRINNVVFDGMAKPENFTLGTETLQLRSPEGKKIYREWADSYAEYDPKKANELLDEIGLTKRDKEGFRTRPDGSRLEVVIDITGWSLVEVNTESAPIIKKNWEAVGIRTILNPVYGTPEETLRETESIYQMRMCHVAHLDGWESETFIFPTQGPRMWPGITGWFTGGARYKEEPKPGSVEERLLELYYKGISTPDVEKRTQILYDAIRIHIEEGPFCIGICAGQPAPIVIKNNFRNVPEYGILGPWSPGFPGAANSEQFFIKK